MTVNETSSQITYLGDGATTVWTFPFPGVDKQFIKVLVLDTFGHLNVIPSNFYTVTLNAPIDPNPTGHGGQVIYPISGPPLAVGTQLLIARDLPVVQSTSISNQSIIYPPVVEQEFDYLTMLDQSGIADSARAFRVGPWDPPPGFAPPVAQRANLQAFFDANGDLSAGGIPVGTVISAVMVPVVTAVTLALARSAMGVPGVDSPVFTGDPKAPTPAVGDNDTSIATTAFVIQALLSNGLGFVTGDLKTTHRTAADPGWILWVDGTIGDPTSGSTIRANADTLQLFTLYYNSYTDANCPLRTSTNVATNRAAQGTATTAFNNHCRMTLPRGSGRKLGIAGAGAGLAAHTIGSFTGSESISQTIDQMPQHSHELIGIDDGTSTFAHGTYNPNANWEPSGSGGVQGVRVGLAGGNNPMNVMNPCSYINVMIKL